MDVIGSILKKLLLASLGAGTVFVPGFNWLLGLMILPFILVVTLIIVVWFWAFVVARDKAAYLAANGQFLLDLADKAAPWNWFSKRKK